MDRNLEMQLAEEFPFMRRKSSLKEQENRDGMVSDLYSAFGCEMRNGWYELMRGLCGEITEAYRDAGVPVDITVDQVKEKYGTLRFYYHFEKHEKRAGAVDLHGDGAARTDPKKDEVHAEIAEITERWEERSAAVCEECGRPALLREDLPWIQTLCDSCYEGAKEKFCKCTVSRHTKT